MDAVITNRVTTAIATAHTILKEAVDIGLFRKQPPPSPLKQWQLGDELSVPIKEGEWRSFDQPIYDDERAKSVIAKAMDGDALADALLRKIACEKLQEGLPPNFASYVSGVLAGDDSQKGRRGSPEKYYARDAAVYLAVDEVRKLGFDATRNSASRHASACSIVVMALSELGVSLSEKSIERIWKETSARYFEYEARMRPLP